MAFEYHKIEEFLTDKGKEGIDCIYTCDPSSAIAYKIIDNLMEHQNGFTDWWNGLSNALRDQTFQHIVHVIESNLPR